MLKNVGRPGYEAGVFYMHTLLHMLNRDAFGAKHPAAIRLLKSVLIRYRVFSVKRFRLTLVQLDLQTSQGGASVQSGLDPLRLPHSDYRDHSISQATFTRVYTLVLGSELIDSLSVKACTE